MCAFSDKQLLLDGILVRLYERQKSQAFARCRITGERCEQRPEQQAFLIRNDHGKSDTGEVSRFGLMKQVANFFQNNGQRELIGGKRGA